MNSQLQKDKISLVLFDGDSRSIVSILLLNDSAAGVPLTAEARVLVRVRIIGLSADSNYESQDDVEDLKWCIGTWIDAIIAANQ